MSWRPVLTGAEAERAQAVALEVASRLAARQQERDDPPMPGLSSASSSIGLVCAQLDRLLSETDDAS